MPEAIIRFTLPLDVCEQAADILNEQGLSVEDAVVMLYRYIAATGKLPFDIPQGGQSNPD